MTVEEFFSLFMEELKENKSLHAYYKFLSADNRFYFRKAYFCQRLQYVLDHIGDTNQTIWDCGCGYGTTALFLAMNGYRVYGTTLEFYFDEIEKRKQWWKPHGNTALFSYHYENLLAKTSGLTYDTIILQDTLHHLEPIGESLRCLQHSLSANGKLLVIEENGANPIQNLKLWRQRGTKKVIKVYDEKLQQTILLGNENIRSMADWQRLLGSAGFTVHAASIHFIRLYPPRYFTAALYQRILSKEQHLAKHLPVLARCFYFGLQFIAYKNNSPNPVADIAVIP